MNRTLAWIAFAIALATSVLAAVLLPSNAFVVVLVVPFAVVGLILVSRRPEHRVGRLFCSFAATFGVAVLANAYGTAGLAAQPVAPGAAEVAWVYSWIWIVYVLQLELALLSFPTGRLAGPRWRWFAGTTFVVGVLLAAGLALRPGMLEDAGITNPHGVEALAPAADAVGVLTGAFLLTMLVSFASPLARLRHTSGDEREQVKWVAAAGVVLASGVIVPGALVRVGVDPDVVAVLSNVSYVVGVVSVPFAMGVAILRYRLYDIELIIRRTLIYGSLLVLLGLAYLAGIGLLQAVLRPLTGGSEIAVALSTLVSVALFQPVRTRVQGAVDRRFYRSRYDAAHILDAFGARLRDEVDLDSVRADLLDVVRDTVRPIHASVWLREARQ